MSAPVDQPDPIRRRRLRRRPLGRYRYVRLRWRVLFTVGDLVGWLLFSVARRLKRWFTPGTRGAAEAPGNVRTILLVQFDHLGDAVLTTAMLPALRRRYPAASLAVLCGEPGREVFAAAPEVDRVYVARVHRFARGRLRRFAWLAAAVWWGFALRRRKLDLAVDVRGDCSVAAILWLAGARRRIGWAAGGGGFLLTDSAEFVMHRPEVESRAALLSVLGVGRRGPLEPLRPHFAPSEPARRRVVERLDELAAGQPLEGPRVVMHVGVGTAAKAWPARHWQELLGRLIVAEGAEVILVGARGDCATAARILGRRPWPGVADWTGRLSIDELGALVERSDVLVGADSGPAHLAAAVGTPVVVLFSGTNEPGQWQPCGPEVRVLRHPVDCAPCHRHRCPLRGHPCMTQLAPERVAAAVASVIERRTGLDVPRSHVEGQSPGQPQHV